MWSTVVSFSSLVGKTVLNVVQDFERVDFITNDGNFGLWHDQDCCENVWLEDVDTPLSRLIGNTILEADEYTENESLQYGDSRTWTFYRLRDSAGNGYVMRWCGESNGFYSEDVALHKI